MRKYDEEFKREAVRKVFEGQPVASVARELGVGEALLHNWKKRKFAAGSGAEKELFELKNGCGRWRWSATY